MGTRDLSQQYFEVLSNDDVKREKVRAVFAIGAVAVLYYLRLMNGGNAFVLLPAHSPYFSAVTTDDILKFWGLYVVGVAVALSGSKFTSESNTLRGRTVRQLLKSAYALAGIAYWFAAIMLFLVAFYYIVLVAVALYPFVLAAIIIGSVYALRKRENRQKVLRAIRLKNRAK